MNTELVHNILPTNPGITLESRPQVSLLTILLSYLQIGLTAFGFSIVQKQRIFVISKKWLSEEEVDEGMALIQLYPGPMMADFSAYVGYKIRGVPGALMAIIGFIAPAFVLMLVLSAIYFASGSLPWVHPLFLGLEALIVGIILNVTLDFGERALKNRSEAVIALAAFAALLLKVNAVAIIVVSLAAGAFLLAPRTGGNEEKEQTHSSVLAISVSRLLAILGIVLVVIAVAIYSWLLDSEVGRMGLSFYKIGAIAFGNGATILPLIQIEIVDLHHWLTPNEFADGIALGQITPGSLLVVAAFAGYKLGGLGAAALMTFAMFAPSFAMTLVFTEIFVRLRNLNPLRGAMKGVLASFVGLLAVVVLQLGKIGISGPTTLILAGGAFVGTRYFKLDIIWIFIGGLLFWSGLLALGLG
ncbi:MAG: chromate efflux transporter [Chloroflexota bacterium]